MNLSPIFICITFRSVVNKISVNGVENESHLIDSCIVLKVLESIIWGFDISCLNVREYLGSCSPSPSEMYNISSGLMCINPFTVW